MSEFITGWWLCKANDHQYVPHGMDVVLWWNGQDWRKTPTSNRSMPSHRFSHLVQMIECDFQGGMELGDRTCHSKAHGTTKDFNQLT